MSGPYPTCRLKKANRFLQEARKPTDTCLLGSTTELACLARGDGMSDGSVHARRGDIGERARLS